ARDHLQVELYLVDDTGPAHLHDDIGGAGQRGSVRLSDRRARQWGIDERGEELVQRATELFEDRGADRRRGYGRRGVLQPRQLMPPLGRQHVLAGGEDLPQLDGGRAELFDRGAGVLGYGRTTAWRAGLPPGPPRHERMDAHAGDEVQGDVAGDDDPRTPAPTP